MQPNHAHDLATRLNRLAAQLQSNTPSRQRRGPGRPDTGIRREYVRLEVYLSPDVRDALDQLADRREAQTGRSTCRADVVREALAIFVQEHSPEGGG